jgi:hypothetical protein
VKAWLHSIALPQYVEAFQEASVDGEMLVELASDNEELLQNEVGVRKRIHRMKIIREIKKLTSARTGVGAPLDTVDDETSGDTNTLIPPKSSIGGGSGSVPPSPHSGPQPVRTKSKSAAHDEAESLRRSLFPPSSHPSSASSTPSHGSVTHLRAPSGSLVGNDHHHGSFSLPSSHVNGSNGIRPSTPNTPLVMTDAVADDEAERIRLLELEKEREQAERDRLYTTEHALQLDTGTFDLLSSLGINKPLGSAIDDTHNNNDDSRPVSLIPVATDSRQSSTGSSGLPSSLTPGTGGNMNGFHHTPIGGPSPMTAVRLMTSISGSSQGSSGSGGVNTAGFTDTGFVYDRPATSSTPDQKRIPEPRQIPYSELVIKEEIGRGQFGTVYVATWRGAPVAVKKLHSQNLSPEQLAHFIREAGIMELLGNHPNGISSISCLVSVLH